MPRLRAAVGYHPEVGDAQLLGDLGDHLKAVSHHSGVLRGDLPAGADVDLGDHQEVGGRLGVDVVKGVDGVPTACAVVFNTIFGLFAAWSVTKFHFKGKKILTTLIDLSLIHI